MAVGAVAALVLAAAVLAVGRLSTLGPRNTAAGAGPGSTALPSLDPSGFDGGGSGPAASDGVTCEPAAAPGSFTVTLRPSAGGPAGDAAAGRPTGVVVAVDLIDAGGARHARLVPLAATADGAWAAVVPGFADAAGCVVTGMQLGDRVVDTGR